MVFPEIEQFPRSQPITIHKRIVATELVYVICWNWNVLGMTKNRTSAILFAIDLLQDRDSYVNA